MYICKKAYTAADGEEKTRTFRVKGEKAAHAYKAAGYTVAEETATVKKAAKSKAKAADTAETAD